KYGTGAINIDASRIATEDSLDRPNGTKEGATYSLTDRPEPYVGSDKGRFPANCITLDSDEFYSKYFNISPEELSKKASKKDRNSDWQGEEIDVEERVAGGLQGRADGSLGKTTYNRNHHPTDKPTDQIGRAHV